jgi:hypothetical protein
MQRYTQYALLAVLVLAGPWAMSAADAQQTPQKSPFAPVEPPSYDPDLLKPPMLPPSSTKIDHDQSGKAKTKIPNRIGVGPGELQFNADRTGNIVAPHVGMDSGEASYLSATRPTQKQTPLPDYFGLKLSVPTR